MPPVIIPCPFCGSVPELVNIHKNGTTAFYIVCNYCFCSGPIGFTNKYEAIVKWNTRISSLPSDVTYPTCFSADRKSTYQKISV